MRIPHAILILAASFILASDVASAEEKLAWSPEQTTGAPDTFKAGDLKTAWATLEKNKGAEWLELEYETPVDVKSIHIRETFNSGAVSKVSVFAGDGTELVVWEGTAPINTAPNVFEVQVSQKIKSKRIIVYLDTKRISGWNEIDAVQLVGKDGTRQWATKATASSTYASKIKKREHQEPTYDNLPPSVVKSVPQAGDTNVNPSLQEIRVTFSKDMLTDRMWAFCQISEGSFPKRPKNSEIHYLQDNRTCVMPVSLEPNKTYAIWVNRGRFNSFRDTQNNPAVPYLLMFKTEERLSNK